MGTETVTLHVPTAIVAPLITAAIISAVTSYWWLIRKTFQLTDIVKDLQHNQAKLTDKVESLASDDRARDIRARTIRDEQLRKGNG